MTVFGILGFCILFVTSTDGKLSNTRQSDCHRTGGSCIRARLSCNGYFDQSKSGCKKSQLCCMKLSQAVSEKPTTQPQQVMDHPGTDQCGLITVLNPVTPDPRLRIVGGQMAVDGEWPWQVGFHDEYRGHFCGGTLISEQWILTAAHCLVRYTPPEVTAVLGEHHLDKVTGKEEKIAVGSWIIHPQYSQSTNNLPNDIALVKLDTPVNISSNYIRKACLPQSTDVFDASDDCSISGWGSTMGTGDNAYLQHMKIEITSREACNETWRGAINDNHICIGNGDIGACQGDSGGPLVCVRNGYYHLAGVTSWGSLSCTAYGYPNVYTKVTSYIEWINANIYL